MNKELVENRLRELRDLGPLANKDEIQEIADLEFALWLEEESDKSEA